MKINTMKTKVTHLKTTKLRKFEELHERKKDISAWASYCSGFPCCGVWAKGTEVSVAVAHGSVVVVPRLQSTGSTVVARGLSWSVAGGIRVQTRVSCIAGGFFTS